MFKKILAVILTVVLLFVTIQPIEGYALTGIGVEINGLAVSFTQSSGVPFLDEANRTQVPFRQTMEQFGASVGWDSFNQIAFASKDGITVKVPIGKKYIYKNSDYISNDTVALIKDGRTYLPIRIVLEAFGADVKWNQSSQQVEVTTKTGSTLNEILPVQTILPYPFNYDYSSRGNGSVLIYKNKTVIKGFGRDLYIDANNNLYASNVYEVLEFIYIIQGFQDQAFDDVDNKSNLPLVDGIVYLNAISADSVMNSESNYPELNMTSYEISVNSRNVKIIEDNRVQGHTLYEMSNIRQGFYRKYGDPEGEIVRVICITDILKQLGYENNLKVLFNKELNWYELQIVSYQQ